MPIPGFQSDGYLPEGLYLATAEEVLHRFGSSSPRRLRLGRRLQRWLELARAVGALRLFINGSFVTAKADPGDLDAVVWLSEDFMEQVYQGNASAVELYHMLVERYPEEIFAAGNAAEWDGWLSFFSLTREPTNRRKGLVEVIL